MKRCVVQLALFITMLYYAGAMAADIPVTTETLKVDTPRATVDGTHFIAPAEWSITTRAPAVILAAPEPGSQIALIEVHAKDADSAVAAAWSAYAPDAKWQLKVAADLPPRDGWEQRRKYTYETSAKDARDVVAVAFRRADLWTVAIYDVADAVGEKRGAQISLILGHLQPKGYVAESFSGKPVHKFDTARIAELKQFIESARKRLDIPGIAVGIVQDNKVIMTAGFGVRELGKPESVDADTLFMIASNTKALTTLMLAQLVDQKRFGWDTPVTQLLPTFKLGNADTTRQVLVKHLVCACTGMPRQDLEFEFNGDEMTPETVVKMLATMQPTSKFGELYQYSNLMAAAGGYVGGHVLYPQSELGVAYDAAMHRLVFAPLGMNATTFNTARALRGNHSAQHGFDVDGNIVLANMNELNSVLPPIRPSGGAWSNVHDMLHYVQMELADGVLPDGQRYVSKTNLLARRIPNVASGTGATYGMGLETLDIDGVKIIHHGGHATGFLSDMIWLPEQNVGAVILTNSESGAFMLDAFRRRLLEILFDGKPEAEALLASRAQSMRLDIIAERKRLTVPADAQSSAKLAAHYRNAALGDIVVTHNAKAATVFDFGGWKSDVASRCNDDGTLSFVTISPGVSGYAFVVTDDTQGHALVLRDAQHTYRFDAVR